LWRLNELRLKLLRTKYRRKALNFFILLYLFITPMNTQNSFIHEVYKNMNEKGVIISYLGDFSYSIVNSLLLSVKKIIGTLEMDFQNKKRFYAVVAECLDNVNRHNYEFDTEKASENFNQTIFNISENKTAFIIQTGNYIHLNKLPLLTANLEKVNSLDREGLKSFYSHKLAESPAKGGGLGIIDISIRSGSKILYECKPVTEDVFFIVLQTTIKK
jgi:hypothetical protein